MRTSKARRSRAGTEVEPVRPMITWALMGLALSILLASLGTSVTNIGLPTLASVFEASFREVQWVILAYLLSITTLIVGAGRLGDMFGRRRLLLFGFAVFTLASAACGAAPTLAMLIVARAVQGLGAAFMLALAMAFVGDIVPKARIGSAMGLLGTMSAIGTAIGPSLGGMLIATVGWRAMFLVNVPLGIAAIAFIWSDLPADRPSTALERGRFDVIGTTLLALVLAAYALAVTADRNGSADQIWALFATAAIGAFAFVFVELRRATPLVRLSLFRDPMLSSGLFANTLVSTVMMATLVIGPFHLTRGLVLDAARAGLIMSIGPIVSALTGIPAGRLVDRFGGGRMALVGLMNMMVGCALLALTPARLGIVGYAAPLAVLTSGYAIFQAANNTMVMADLPAERRGLVSGVLNLSRNFGLMTGASVLGAVFAWASGADPRSAAPDDVVVGTHATFAVALVLVVLAMTATATSLRCSDTASCASCLI